LNSMSDDEEQEPDKIQSTAAAARHFQEYTCLVYVWMRPSKQLFIFAMEVMDSSSWISNHHRSTLGCI